MNRIVAILLAVIVGGLLLGTVATNVWINRATAELSPEVRSATQAVLRAQFWNRISGSYWEDEMEKQASLVSTLPEHDRIAFLRTILLYCDLDTSRATTFAEAIGNDAEALRKNLQKLKNSRKFENLPLGQQKDVIAWIDDLSNLSN